ncbi:hypothetical protein V6Z12_D06G030000 [Gossypium hirsutum]
MCNMKGKGRQRRSEKHVGAMLCTTHWHCT